MDYCIRLAQPSDVDYLPTIEGTAAQQYLPYISKLGLTPENLDDTVSVKVLTHAQRQQHLWVAVVSDSSSLLLAGFVVVNRLGNGFFIVELDVLPTYGRQGIGFALVNQVLNAAHEQNYPTVTLTTFRYIPWTIPFYHRLGFEIVGPENYTPDIQTIVDHEEHRGFSRQVRVVMQCQIPNRFSIHSVPS